MIEESTSHVEQQVQARIAAARVKIQAARERRDELSTARRRGLAARHSQKLRNLAASEQRQAEVLGHDDAQDLDQPEPGLHMAQDS